MALPTKEYLSIENIKTIINRLFDEELILNGIGENIPFGILDAFNLIKRDKQQELLLKISDQIPIYNKKKDLAEKSFRNYIKFKTKDLKFL